MKKIIFIFAFFVPFLFSADKIVAFVENSPVFESEVYQIISYDKLSYDEALEKVIQRKLIVEKSKKEDIKVSDEEIGKEFQKIRQSFPDEKSFMENLKKSGLTISQLKNIIKEQIISRKYIDKEIISKIEIPPSEIANFINNHLEITKYNFKFKWFETKKTAEEFCLSPDITKMEESGYLKEDEILSEILTNLKKIGKGEFSSPFEVGNKFIVVYLSDVKKEKVENLKDLYITARRKIFNEKFNTMYKQLVSKLKNEMLVRIIE